MSITVKATLKTKSVLVDLSKHTQTHRKAIRPALHEIGLRLGRTNKHIITTGKRTGRRYGNHTASAFGEPPANRTGRLYKSYDYRVASWHTMFVGEEAPYADFLERGTRKMKPRQHLILAINKTSGDAVRTFYEYGKRGLKI